jgi:hypothetical protein
MKSEMVRGFFTTEHVPPYQATLTASSVKQSHFNETIKKRDPHAATAARDDMVFVGGTPCREMFFPLQTHFLEEWSNGF